MYSPVLKSYPLNFDTLNEIFSPLATNRVLPDYN